MALTLPKSFTNTKATIQPAVKSIGKGASISKMGTFSKPGVDPWAYEQGTFSKPGVDPWAYEQGGNVTSTPTNSSYNPKAIPDPTPYEEIKPITIAPLPELPPPPQSYLPQLQELGQQRLNQGTAALQDLFPQQREAVAERSSQRGLTGSGVAEELYGRQAKQEDSQLRQLIGEIEAQNLSAEIQEMQRVGSLTADQASLRYELEANRALAQGDMDKGIAIENAHGRAVAKQLKFDADATKEELRLKGIEIDDNRDYNRLTLQNQGTSLENEYRRTAATVANGYAPEGGDDYMEIYYEICRDGGYPDPNEAEWQKNRKAKYGSPSDIKARNNQYDAYVEDGRISNPLMNSDFQKWDYETGRAVPK